MKCVVDRVRHRRQRADALPSFNCELVEVPATPQRVWRAIQEGKAKR